MSELLLLLIIFLIGCIASVIGSIAGGGGGLISTPLLILTGFPAKAALALNKFGGIGISSGEALKYHKEKKIVWRYVLTFSILGGIGSLLGAFILVALPSAVVSIITSVILLCMIPILFLGKDLGMKFKSVSRHSEFVGYALYFFGGIWGGFFGAGGGLFMTFITILFFGLPILETYATNSIPWLVLSFVALVVFVTQGLVRFDYGIALFLGMLLGGYAGAHIAVKKGNAFLKVCFALVILASVVKLLFF